MKKKISVFALLIFLLFALVSPSSAKADDSITTLCVEACDALVNNGELYSKIISGSSYVIGYSYENERVEMLIGSSTRIGYLNNSGVYLCDNYNSAVSANSYKYENGGWVAITSGVVRIWGQNGNAPLLIASSFNKCVNLTQYDNIPTLDEYLYGYSFISWCADADLNCLASSNESDTVIPYSFNDYWHIVRKSSSGNWLLTTIGSTLGQSKMNLRLSESGNLIIYEYSGDDSFTISVRQYVYDTDGWKLRSYDTYDYDNFSSGLLTLPAGSGLDDTRVLAYTSTNIYSSDGLSVYAAASTEYVEPSSPDVTPEPTPGSGSSGSGDSDDSGSSGSGTSGGGRPGTGTRPSVGGEASGGGGLDFIINLFTLIWTKICSVPMSVDGYSISLQQIFVYGALVSIVGGFIIKFIFRR